jgi:hypothetical protein
VSDLDDTRSQADVIAQAWYEPQSWVLLEAAIAAAGMPKTMLVGSYEDFVSAFDCFVREFARQGIRVEPTPIDVPHMVAWCARWGLRIDSVGRTKYVAALAMAGGDLAEVDRRPFVDRTRTEH